jgi:hypothetical protein
MKTGTRTMKTAGVALALALAAGAVGAQSAATTTATAATTTAATTAAAAAADGVKVTGWVRAGAGLDFENKTQLGAVPDMDPTGAGATLTWTKGKWAVEGAAQITSDDFGTTLNKKSFGSVKATYADGDWTVYGKLKQNFDEKGLGEWKDNNAGAYPSGLVPVTPFNDTDGDGDPTNDKDYWVEWNPGGRTVEFSVENWKQDVNPWGVKAVAVFNMFENGGLPRLEYEKRNDYNLAGFFINFLGGKVLLEGGYGNYSGAAVWTSPGPYERQYERTYDSGTDDEEDSAVRLQIKPIAGLNFGFAYLPAGGGFAASSSPYSYWYWKDTLNNPVHPKFSPGPYTAPVSGFWAQAPGDAIRASTFGAKYAPADLPVVVAAGMNLAKDAEKGYGGLSYALLDKKLTFSVDGEFLHGRFAGGRLSNDVLHLGQKIKFVDDPTKDAAGVSNTTLEAGLILKEARLAHSVDGTSVKDLELYVEPYAWYEFIPGTARAKVALGLTKGLGEEETNGKHIAWTLTTTLGWSVVGKPALAVNDIGTGFVVRYQVGSEKDKYFADPRYANTWWTKETNKLYFGFKVSY